MAQLPLTKLAAVSLAPVACPVFEGLLVDGAMVLAAAGVVGAMAAGAGAISDGGGATGFVGAGAVTGRTGWGVSG